MSYFFFPAQHLCKTIKKHSKIRIVHAELSFIVSIFIELKAFKNRLERIENSKEYPEMNLEIFSVPQNEAENYPSTTSISNSIIH